MSLRPQAHDIIRTRLLYTTLQTYLKTGQIPFQDVMISGHVLAGKSEKISKSAGNTKTDPEQLIKQRGADAVRYRTAGGQLGKDMVFDEEELKKGQKLVTKLWNAFQFVKMQLNEFDVKTEQFPNEQLYATERWILTRLNATIDKMNKYLDNYEYGLAKIAFEEFFWRDFCDNYLELVKVRLYQPERFEDGEKKKKSGQQILHFVFLTIIKLIAPYLPHISEEIYQEYFRRDVERPSIHKSGFPPVNPHNTELGIEEKMSTVLEIVEQVRKYKSESQISMGAELSKLIISANQEQKQAIQLFLDDVQGVTKAKEIEREEGTLGVKCVQ